MNPLFKSLTKKNSLPSVEEYLKIHQIVEKKDPHFDQLVAFLKGVDGYLVVGTPNHIAPEIFETRIFSRASDIYSLGYSMIRLKEQMELHSFYYHTVEIGFDELVNQMTHQDPSKRPSLEKVMARLLQLISIQKSSS
jgi:serine/threonine protein kinase